MSAFRLSRRLLAVILSALVVLMLPMTQAHAEDGYRYWSYFEWDGSQWAYAQSGADSTVPADGSVEGWRFATSGATPRPPRATTDFDSICAAAPAEEGRKRIAVVIDQGTDADAPAGDKPEGTVRGTCVVAAPEATGAEVVGSVAPLRAEQGMICGLGGYPTTACVDTINLDTTPVDEPLALQVQPPVGSSTGDAGPQQTGQEAPSPAPFIVGGAVVLVLAGGGIWLARRNRTA